ncbi:unnamed protein product [Rotaria socialis]|uniref:SCP domain-containing protein n=2 Tax=Rotaria socialis TaxID=392032 RepID=A0A818YB21_9BILA|nr:unnamed protein product [Rotaria socialis]
MTYAQGIGNSGYGGASTACCNELARTMTVIFQWDRRFSRLMIHPNRQFGQHHDRRLVLRPIHRYQHPLAFHIDMDMRNLRTHRYESNRTRHLNNDKYIHEMLKLHNYYRARHCSPPLAIDQRLNQIAQSYAEHLAATSTFEHSGNRLGDKALGENLYMEWISYGRVKATPKAAMSSWYDEIAMHDFEHPKFSSETGHFTQLVWKSSRKLGVGIAFSEDKREVYVVANYFPGGNITNRGYFEANVLPANC